MLRVEGDVVFDEAGDEEIAVIIISVVAEGDMISCAVWEGGFKRFGFELFG